MLAVEKIESEKKFQQLTTSIQFFNLNVQTNGNEPSFRGNESSQINDELQHYYNMIKAVLNSIDTAERFLDEKRYHRLKTGFTTLHNMEAHRLREIYGSRASELFSQLKITPVRNEPAVIPQQPMTQCPPPQAAQLNSAKKKKKKKRRIVSNDELVRGKPMEPQIPNSFNSELPKKVLQPFNDLSVPSDQSTPYLDNTAFNLDFSALDNPEILENFDFDTFLNTDGDQGFGFDPNIESNDTIDASLQPSLKRKQDAYGDLGGSPTVEDTSPENPDLWVLRWTTLKKAELHQ